MRKENSKRKTGASLRAGPLRPAIYIAEKGRKKGITAGIEPWSHVRASSALATALAGFLRVLYSRYSRISFNICEHFPKFHGHCFQISKYISNTRSYFINHEF